MVKFTQEEIEITLKALKMASKYGEYFLNEEEGKIAYSAFTKLDEYKGVLICLKSNLVNKKED